MYSGQGGLPDLNGEPVSLEPGPDAPADVGIWDPVVAAIVADGPSPGDLPGLLVDEEQFQRLGSEQRGGRPTPQGPCEDILYCLFLSASRIGSMLPSSPKDSTNPIGKADSLNLAKAVILNLAQHEPKRLSGSEAVPRFGLGWLPGYGSNRQP